eukprot:SAG11_NODE_9222_length_931_cov_2.722356_3_plen_87_part_00
MSGVRNVVFNLYRTVLAGMLDSYVGERVGGIVIVDVEHLFDLAPCALQMCAYMISVYNTNSGSWPPCTCIIPTSLATHVWMIIVPT